MHWLGESVRNRLPDIHCAYGFKLAYPLKRTVGNIYLGALLLRMRHLGTLGLGPFAQMSEQEYSLLHCL